ncbi:hypothetical protein C8Q77DRAFT_58557 [Trametes polyzona]|nr:hypothetical protein C8Q77DRAFT_58557 [Trametes polyzona]
MNTLRGIEGTINRRDGDALGRYSYQKGMVGASRMNVQCTHPCDSQPERLDLFAMGFRHRWNAYSRSKRRHGSLPPRLILIKQRRLRWARLVARHRRSKQLFKTLYARLSRVLATILVFLLLYLTTSQWLSLIIARASSELWPIPVWHAVLFACTFVRSLLLGMHRPRRAPLNNSRLCWPLRTRCNRGKYQQQQTGTWDYQLPPSQSRLFSSPWVHCRARE